jgi:hypothetical protein
MMHLNNFYSLVDFNSIKLMFLEKYHHAARGVRHAKAFGGTQWIQKPMLTFVNNTWKFFIP